MANEQNLKPFRNGYDVRRGSKPKGSRHVSSYIKEFLEGVEIKYTLMGTEVEGTPIEAIIKGTIIKAIQGDLKASEMLFKYGYGPSDHTLLEEQKKLIIIHRRYKSN